MKKRPFYVVAAIMVNLVQVLLRKRMGYLKIQKRQYEGPRKFYKLLPK